MITIRCLNEKKADVSYTLLVGKTYTVGRKGGDISFPDDQSVSRNHAEIYVEHPMANVSDPLLIPIVVLTDLGSKFGTFANEGISNMSPLSMREPMNLCAGDKFRFGRQWNVFQIDYTPLVITSSTIKDLAKLKKVIMTLGGHMVNEWNPKCDFIVMESLTLTVKAVCAILSGKHVVIPSYFDDLYECVLTKKRKPDPRRFLPPLGEKSLEADGLSFDPNPERKKLFDGKTFLFASQKQLNKIGAAVTCGGGKCELISNVMSSRPANMKNPDFILLSPGVEPAMLDSRIREGIELYKRAKKRLVLDSELGLAAVYNSTEKHCNPTITLNERNIPQKLGSQTQPPRASSSVPVVVPDTQISSSSSQVPEKNTAEGSFAQPKPVEPHPNKVKIENDEDDDIMISEVIPPGGSSGAANKRIHNGKDSGQGSSKKRAAEDCLPRDSSGTGSSLNSSKRMRTVMDEDSEQSQRALSNIFGMFSDDEDENVEFAVSRIPDTPGSSEIDESVKIVTPPVRSTPPSPDMFEISDTEDTSSFSVHSFPTNNENSIRSTRSRSKVDSPVKPKSPTKQNPLPRSEHVESSSNRNNRNKRKDRSSDESTKSVSVIQVQSVKKRKVNDAEEDARASGSLESRTERLCIKTTEIKKENVDNKLEEDLDVIEIPVIVVPLLKKATNRPTMTECEDGRRVKNFKRFNKVLPCAKNSELSVVGEYRNGAAQGHLGDKLTFIPYVDPAETDFMHGERSDQDEKHEAVEDPMEDENIPVRRRNPFGGRTVGQISDSEDEEDQPRRRPKPRAAAVVKERRSTTGSTAALPGLVQSSQAVEEDGMWDF